jgi:hypothetical protein
VSHWRFVLSALRPRSDHLLAPIVPESSAQYRGQLAKIQEELENLHHSSTSIIVLSKAMNETTSGYETLNDTRKASSPA